MADDYKGTGTYTDFVSKCVGTIKAFSNGIVKLSAGMDGIATLGVEGSGDSASLVLDLQEAPVFTLDNVVWKTRSGATITEQTVEIRGNVLVINYTAT